MPFWPRGILASKAVLFFMAFGLAQPLRGRSWEHARLRHPLLALGRCVDTSCTTEPLCQASACDTRNRAKGQKKSTQLERWRETCRDETEC